MTKSLAGCVFGALLAVVVPFAAYGATATASPTACENMTGVGSVAWTNPGRATVSDDSYATATVDGTTTNYLYCHDYGFAIPAGSLISGIAVHVERKSSSTSNGGSRDADLFMVRGGSIVGTDGMTSTAYTIADVVEVHGGAASTWGVSPAWSATDINAANFGVAFAATKPNSSGSPHTLSVDRIHIVITYTPPRSCSTVKTGNWSDATVWNCGSGPGDGPPTAIDSATINNHTITLNADASVATLTNNGTLQRTATTSRTVTVSSDFTNNSSVTNTAGSGTLTFNVGGNFGNNGSGISANTLTVSGNATINAALTITGTFSAGGDVVKNGNNAFSVGTLAMQKSGIQELTLFNGSNSIGTFTVASGSTVSASTYSVFNVTGNVTNNGALSLPNADVTFNGTAAQTIGGTADSTIGSLIMNNSAGLTLNRNLTVNKVLTLTNGKVTTGTYSLNVTGKNCSDPAVSGGSTSSYVIGNLRLLFPAYNASCTYPIGGASAYAPITVTFPWFNGIAGGTLTAYSTAGQHLFVDNSGIDSSKNVNRYWTLGASGDTLTSLPVDGKYDVQIGFQASEVLGGGSIPTFKVARYDTSGAWIAPTGTTTTGSPLNNAVSTENRGFGSFVVGPPGQGCSPPSNIPNGVSVSCVCDKFILGTERAALNPSPIFGANWKVTESDGTGVLPYIASSGYLRLTPNQGYRAKAATAPGIFPAAGNYISVDFKLYAYGGNGADGIAVTLSDYSVPAVPGAYGGSLGYAQFDGGRPGFAGGWIGVAMDEYGNYQNPNESRVLGRGFTVDSVGVRGSGSGTSGYPWLGGTATLTPGVDVASSASPAPGHTYQVIVDARNEPTSTAVQVNRDTGTGYVSLVSIPNVYTTAAKTTYGYTQAPVPNNWQISFTASTGGSNNYHEISSLRICAQYMYPPDGSVSDGFSAIDEAYGVAGGAGASADAVKIQQYMTGHIYTKLIGEPFKLNVAALKNGAKNKAYVGSVTKYVQLKLVNNSDKVCAINTDGSCPSTCVNKAAITSQVLSFLPNPTQASGDVQSAAITLNTAYSNLAAVMRECSDASCNSFTSTPGSCSVDQFSVRPKLVSQVVTSNATNTSVGGTPVFKAGSDGFSLEATIPGVAGAVSGYTGVLKIDNAAVQAVAPAGMAVGSVLKTGTIGGTFEAAQSSTGSATGKGSAFTYSEVGAFQLTGVPLTGDSAAHRGVFDGVMGDTECLGLVGESEPDRIKRCDGYRAGTWTGVDSITTKGDCVPDNFSNTKNADGKYGCNFGLTTTSATMGRFIPHHFELSGVAVGNRADLASCSSSNFTYMGEPLALAFTLTAKNGANTTVENYDQGLSDGGTPAVLFSKLPVAKWLSIKTLKPSSDIQAGYLNLWAIDNKPSSPAAIPNAADRFSTTLGAESPNCTAPTAPSIIANRWCKGVANFRGSFTLARNKDAASLVKPDGAFENFTLGLAPQDADGITLASDKLDIDIDLDASKAKERQYLGQTKLRFGLLKLTTVYGSEQLPLSVPIEARYWNGTGFILNTDDACTVPALAAANVAWTPEATTLTPSISYSVTQPGKGRIVLPTPDKTKRTAFRVCLDISSDVTCKRSSGGAEAAFGYLTGPWDGSSDYDRDPSARAVFGLSRGAYLYYRELY